MTLNQSDQGCGAIGHWWWSS